MKWMHASLLVAAAIVLLVLAPRAVAEQVYTLSGDGAIRSLQFGPCRGAGCRWVDIDRNARTMALAGSPHGLFQLHSNGEIWRWQGRPCLQGRCLSWERLDRNRQTVAIASGGGELYQLHRDGSIWRWKGSPCTADRCNSWEKLDRNPRSREIVAAAGHLYQLHDDGSIWEWQGEPCSGSVCASWLRLDRNRRTKDIAARGSDLFQLHDNGSIWRWSGEPCRGNACTSWVMLDNNPGTRAIRAARGGLYQLHRDGSIWKWDGQPCRRTSCSSWSMLDNNRDTVDIAAAGDALYQVHRTGRTYRWLGRPCQRASCASWIALDDGHAFTRFNARRTGLYAFDGLAFASAPLAGNGTARAMSPDRLRPFGYDTRQATGSRPLLTILVNARGASYSLQPKASYDRVIYSQDPGTLSIVNYYKSVSRNAFHFWKAGLLGPYNLSSPTAAMDLRAADADIDFSRFDTNHDGQVTPDELTILVIDNLTQGLGTQLNACLTLDGVRVCRNVAAAGGRSLFYNIAHEIGHQLGPGDIYGSNCWNQNRGLMGTCTANTAISTPLAPRSVEFSPWNRMRFGWLKPQLISTTSPGGCTALTAPSYQFADNQALLFYDPSRGTHEYFMLEHRTNASGGDFTGQDSLFPGRGLAPWYVSTKTSPEGDIDVYTDASGTTRQDRLILMVANPGPRSQRRQPPLPPDGSFTALKWLNNGQTAVRVSSRYASPRDQAVLQVEWNAGVPFPPSFTFPRRLHLHAVQDGMLNLPQGIFGIAPDGRTFELRGQGRRIALTASQWSCHHVQLAIPADVPQGDYELVATDGSWTSSQPLNASVRIGAPGNTVAPPH